MTDQQTAPPPFRQGREPGAAAGQRIRIAVAQTPVTTDPRANGAAVRPAVHTALVARHGPDTSQLGPVHPARSGQESNTNTGSVDTVKPQQSQPEPGERPGGDLP